MKDICETLRLRLLIMEKIAMYKFIHNLPLCDRERENLILKEIVEMAKSMGLSEKGVKSFFVELMSVSKTVQSHIICRYHFDEKFEIVSPGNIVSIRKDIDKFNIDLLDNIKKFVTQKFDLKPENFILFCSVIDVPHLSIIQKKRLFDELQKVTLN